MFKTTLPYTSNSAKKTNTAQQRSYIHECTYLWSLTDSGLLQCSTESNVRIIHKSWYPWSWQSCQPAEHCKKTHTVKTFLILRHSLEQTTDKYKSFTVMLQRQVRRSQCIAVKTLYRLKWGSKLMLPKREKNDMFSKTPWPRFSSGVAFSDINRFSYAQVGFMFFSGEDFYVKVAVYYCIVHIRMLF